MTQPRIVTGIDIGTHQVKVVIATVPERPKEKSLPQIIGTGFAESRGLRNGYIVNETDVLRGVKSALLQAEKAAGLTVKRASLAIGSIGLGETWSHGEVITNRADLEITQTDIDKALSDSEERIIDTIPNRKILHVVPLSFAIDGEPVFGRALGMQGKKLTVDSLFITTYEQHLHDFVQVIENAGLIVEDVLAAPLAASFVMLEKVQKRAGCILVNIGAETVSTAVFENNIPISVKVFPIGSNNITNDIALGLKISLREAEKIKCGGISSTHYSKRKLDEIVNARLSDIFELIDTQLKQVKRDGLLPAGVTIIGGGAGLSGIKELASTKLRLPARTDAFDPGQTGKVHNASWAVAYGLCLWGASDETENTGIDIAKKTKSTVFSWIQQFLP